MDYMNMLRANGGHHAHHQGAYFLSPYGGAAPQHQQQHTPPPQQTQQQQGYSFPYTNEQLIVLSQMQQHRNLLNHQAAMAHAAAAANASGGVVRQPGVGPGSKQADPKPRLSKDEVEILEKEFQKNPKPSTGRKREIADQLKVEQPRINNWFQNRRAKEKGLKKTQEFVARKAAEEAGSKTPDTDDQNVSEYYGLSNHEQPVQPSSSAFPDDSTPVMSGSEHCPHSDSSATGSPVDDAFMTSDGLAVPVEAFSSSARHSHSPFGSDHVGSHLNELEEYPSPRSLPVHQQVQHADLDFTPLAPNFPHAQQDATNFQEHQHQSCSSDNFMAHNNLNVASFASSDVQVAMPHLDAFGNYGASTASSSPPDNTILAPTPSFPSQLLGRLEFDDIKEEAESSPEASDASLVAFRPEEPSPNSMPLSPPTPTDLRFKSPPPPANLASRRNKAGSLAQLNATALRGYQYGPKTGMDLTKRTDTASPLRRVASATGPGNMAAGIRKASLASQPPRSPLYLERTKDALMRSFQQSVRSPVLPSINTALSPGTPNDSYLSISSSSAHPQQDVREATVSSSTSDDEGRLTLNTAPPTSLFANLKTPPGTPGLNGSFADQLSARNGSSTSMNAFEAAWNYNPVDEPLVTPGLGSFGSEEFTMAAPTPSYVCGGTGVVVGSSQPPTPSFPHNGFSPSSLGGAGHVGGYPWAFGPGGPGNAEYTFPDSYVPDASAKSSPGLPPQVKSKMFQFTQNVTPQDFTEK